MKTLDLSEFSKLECLSLLNPCFTFATLELTNAPNALEICQIAYNLKLRKRI